MSLNELRKVINDIINLDVHKYLLPENLAGKDIILFGASEAGKFAKNFLMEKNIKIKYFCDNDKSKWEKEFEGTRILSPEEICKLPESALIMITSMHLNEIRKQLISAGCRNIYDFFYSRIKMCLKCKDILKNSIEEIEEAYNILTDEKSKKVFRHVIKQQFMSHMEKRRIFSEVRDSLENKYFDTELIKINGDNEIFVDANTFDGQTSVRFKHLTKDNFRKIYLFDPDEFNFTQTQKSVAVFNDSRFILMKNRLNNKTEHLNFELDNLIDEKITFIKLDTEGLEIPALEGAEKIIKKYKPKMAVAVYYDYKDLWKVPLLINKLNKNYKIYLRSYAYWLSETVCYAIN